MVDLHPEQMAIVESILCEKIPNLEVWAFGSRVSGTAKMFSDLDLAVLADEPLPLRLLGEVRDAFAESDLAVKVDVVDFARAAPEFQKIILKNHVVIRKP